MKIFVSGLYAGGNPQPGVGIVRSLRQGYPDATIVGVEYSNRVSGIHFDELDELWIQRPWGELDLETYGDKIGEAGYYGDGVFYNYNFGKIAARLYEIEP